MARRRRFKKTLGARADVAGLMLAATNLPLSFQRTLMPRPTTDQAIVTGLSAATNHFLVEFVQESIQAATLIALGRGGSHTVDESKWSKTTIAADLAAIGIGVAAQRAFAQHPREPLPRAGARTAGFWLSVTGTAGAIVGAIQEGTGTFRTERRFASLAAIPVAGGLMATSEFLRRRAARLDGDLGPDTSELEPVKAIAMSLVVAGALSAVGAVERAGVERIARTVSRVLPGNAAVWRPLGHALALGASAAATRFAIEQVYGRLERGESSVESAFDLPPPNPLVSSCRTSAVPFSTLSRQGRRFVWTVPPPGIMRSVTGADDVHQPIRVYVGLESAPTTEERVALVLGELDRTDAWERDWLLIATPTGTGYTNYAAVAALEMLSIGNCASVSMQYSQRPSVLSLDRVAEGSQQVRALIDALHARMEEQPVDRRPKVVLFGESLGAWSSQNAFVHRGTDGLVDSGIDHAIWIGTPYFSKWKEQVLHDDRPDVEPDLVRVCASIENWRALSDTERERARYVMVTHHDDGVALFGPDLMIQSPPWLGPPDERPSGVPRSMRWFPSTTFFQVLVDMKNSANVVAGQFDAKGHDYRADLLPFFDAVLGFDTPTELLGVIGEYLEGAELRRTGWIHDHGGAGKSMSVAIVERALAELDADGVDTDAVMNRLMRSVLIEEFGAVDGLAATDGPRSGTPDAISGETAGGA